jgi:hypothetical protein
MFAMFGNDEPCSLIWVPTIIFERMHDRLKTTIMRIQIAPHPHPMQCRNHTAAVQTSDQTREHPTKGVLNAYCQFSCVFAPPSQICVSNNFDFCAVDVYV